MTLLDLVTAVPMAGILLRQLVVLAAVARSARFLRQPPPQMEGRQEPSPVFFVVLPVLREASVIVEAVTHFEGLVHGHRAQIVVVTTEREHVEAPRHGVDADTVALVEQLADAGKVVHLHYPDPDGLKGDQLNYAARYCATTLLGDVPPEQAFLVCYDADSRPPPDSLDRFAHVAAASGGACVFHQSASFELRAKHACRCGHARSWLSHGFGEAAALRANRFVLGFEIPRLINQSGMAGRIKRWLCSNVYAHVTGHGLCIRLSLLLEMPFPARSPLEDMHYSFCLGSRNLAMVPVPSLDRAEVPDTVRAQVGQAARWFFGPARFLRYLRDPATQRGPHAVLMAASAFGSALEWLGCAVVPVVTLLLAVTPGPARWAAIAVVVSYSVQLLITDMTLCTPAPWPCRIARMLLCPVAMTLFGAGGFAGMVTLLTGGSGVGKTERR